MNRQLRFKNKKFKIMQITDIQENAELNPDTIRLMSRALEKERPDLVVLTGDQIQGYSPCYLSDAENKVKKVISAFLSPMEQRGIPFCFTFGNHDDDCRVSKTVQAEHYKSFECCVYSQSASENDPGTYMLRIKNEAGDKDILGLYLFDTGKMALDGSFPPVSQQQLQWYRDKREEAYNELGHYLPSVVFQHIPLPEFYDIIDKVSFFTKGRVEAYKSRRNTFYKLDDETIARGGFMGESPCTPDKNSGQFDALKEKGDVFALFVGHDHNNSFYKNHQGIDLGYCQGAGFNTYGPHDKRGVRVFVFDEDNVRDYETYTVTMGELCDYKPSKPFREFVFSNAPVSPDQVLTDLSRIALTAVGIRLAVSAVKGLIKIIRK